jgi:NAD(P)H dehydrogenase (quinone)
MILVTGTTGQLGSAILDALTTRGTTPLAGNRSGRDGARRIDFDDPGSVSFVGVDTLVLVSAGEAEDDVVIARHETAVAAAERDGVRHIVYTSLATAGDHLAFALAHRWTERRLERSPLSWTILRNGLYAELFGSLLEWSGGSLGSAFGDGALAAVTRADLAEAAAVVAMTPGAHIGRRYDLVGDPITAGQVADRLGVGLHSTSLAERREALRHAPLKPFQPPMLLSIFSAVRHGFLAGTGDDLGDLLGREPADTVPVAAASVAVPSP